MAGPTRNFRDKRFAEGGIQGPPYRCDINATRGLAGLAVVLQRRALA